MMTKTARIVAALRSGAATSQEIADKVRSPRRRVSVALCRLAALGVIERAGIVNAQHIGRPYVRWRICR
jgi:predicted ArsR family transcriptional regulator